MFINFVIFLELLWDLSEGRMNALGDQVVGSKPWQLNCSGKWIVAHCSQHFPTWLYNSAALSSPRLASILLVPTLYSRQLSFTLPLPGCLSFHSCTWPPLYLHGIQSAGTDSGGALQARHARAWSPPEPDKRRFNYGAGSNFPVKTPITRLLVVPVGNQWRKRFQYLRGDRKKYILWQNSHLPRVFRAKQTDG